jgi:hypothetical protein
MVTKARALTSLVPIIIVLATCKLITDTNVGNNIASDGDYVDGSIATNASFTVALNGLTVINSV